MTKGYLSGTGQLLYYINDPVTLCVNCICQYCVNNVEKLWTTVQPDEVKESCFNCEECYEFTGDVQHKIKPKWNCSRFLLSDYGAARNRKYMKLVNTK